jgi:hypothetical protein
MTQQNEEFTPVTPLFIREREAWLRAGASMTASYSGAAVLVIDALIAIVSHFTEGHNLEIALVVGALFGIAISSKYVEIFARETAQRGGVDVDPF